MHLNFLNRAAIRFDVEMCPLDGVTSKSTSMCLGIFSDKFELPLDVLSNLVIFAKKKKKRFLDNLQFLSLLLNLKISDNTVVDLYD